VAVGLGTSVLAMAMKSAAESTHQLSFLLDLLQAVHLVPRDGFVRTAPRFLVQKVLMSSVMKRFVQKIVLTASLAQYAGEG